MQVQWRPPWPEVAVLDYEEIATRLLCADLEGQFAEAEGVEIAKAVFAGSDGVELGRGGWNRERVGDSDGRGDAKKGTAVHRRYRPLRDLKGKCGQCSRKDDRNHPACPSCRSAACFLPPDLTLDLTWGRGGPPVFPCGCDPLEVHAHPGWGGRGLPFREPSIRKQPTI